MTKHTLSDTAKQFLNFEDNSFNAPISFGEKPLPVIQRCSSTESSKYDKVPSVVWDAIRYMENAVKLDADGFETFLESKSSNMNIRTDNDIFDKRAFEADMKALEREYNEETAWLKMHTPKSPEEMSTWNQRLQARDNLRLSLPKAENPKYHTKEIMSVTKSGLECKSILERFNRECKKISDAFDAQMVNDYVEAHKITMDEETFAFVKMMHRLGQFTYDFIARIPTTVIRMGSSADIKNDLENAVWNFDSIAEYNKSLETKNLSLSGEMVIERNKQKASLMSTDIEMAARAILSYATEFEALVKATCLDKPLI